MKEQKTAVEAKMSPMPGERAFALALFLLGVAAFLRSIALCFAISPPVMASAAALPLLASGLWATLSLVILAASPGKGRAARGIRQALGYALPAPLPAIITAIAAYCLALLLHVSFYIATPLFLWGAMCYLTRRDFLKNILWTALIMGFILLIFTMLFHVILP
ncbi:MAG: tripartite tricarboxylate transporter TctB family protein [Clostridiales bacterium]|nr:tripartite tricarboxylate transporter TctB family protein [Clostridiales bacterium]